MKKFHNYQQKVQHENTPPRNLATEDQVQGAYGAEKRNVPKLSTELIKQLPLVLEFPAKSNIKIIINKNIILITPHCTLTNEDIVLFNNEIFQTIENLKNIGGIDLDLRAVQELPFFFIGSLLSIYDKVRPTKLQIKNASPYTIKMLTEYELDKILTINS